MSDPDGTASSATEFRLVEEEPRQGTVVLAVFGDVDLHVADELGDRLVAMIERGATAVVVDLSGVTFVDSQGLGALLRGTRKASASQGRLRLVVPRAEIRRIFEITSLDEVFPLDASREEAFARSDHGKA